MGETKWLLLWNRFISGRSLCSASSVVMCVFALGACPDARADLVDTYGGPASLSGFGGAVAFTGVLDASAACDALVTAKRSLLNASQTMTKGSVLATFAPNGATGGNLCAVVVHDNANNSNTNYTATFGSLQRIQQRKCIKPAGTKITIHYDPAEHGGVRKSMPSSINGYGVDDCNWTQAGIGLELSSSGERNATYTTMGATASAPSPADPLASAPSPATDRDPTLDD